MQELVMREREVMRRVFKFLIKIDIVVVIASDIRLLPINLFAVYHNVEIRF